jgi:starvation-inducible DNA-binding protein
MYNQQQSQAGKAELAMSLGSCLGSTFTFYMKAHGFHWNVKGQDFVEFHKLFSSIYEDAHGAVDPLAETILQLGYDAPATLSHMLSLSVIAENDNEATDDPVMMSASLLEANNKVNECILRSFALANSMNEQGIANLLAERDAAHKKWAWQLRAITGMQMGGQLMGTSSSAPVAQDSEDEMMYDQFGFFAAGSKPAPKKDQIKGSSVNPKGSAAGGRSIKFSAKTETALMNKVKEHNKDAKPGHKATLAQLKAVYRRGAGAFSSSHRPGKTRDQWAMARVNAYLHLLKAGRPSNPNYKQDNDLLPNAHPKSTASIVASALAADELFIELNELSEYQSAEHAVIALAEYSGLGYEIIPSLRAAWKRGVDENQNGFERARELAIATYDSEDADLLPQIES